MATIRRNNVQNGIEIKFSEKPSDEILSWLHSKGYRYSKFNKVWYKKYSEYDWNVATEFFQENEAEDNPLTKIETPYEKTARINVNDPKERVNRGILRSEFMAGKMLAARTKRFNGMIDSYDYIKESEREWTDKTNNEIEYAINSEYEKGYISSEGHISKGDFIFKYKPEIIIPQVKRPKAGSKSDFYVNFELKPEIEEFEIDKNDSDNPDLKEGDEVEAEISGRKVCGKIIKKKLSYYTIRHWGQTAESAEKRVSVSYELQLKNGVIINGYSFRKADGCSDNEPMAVFFSKDKEFKLPDRVYSDIHNKIKSYKSHVESAGRRKKAQYRNTDLANAESTKKHAFNLMAVFLGWELEGNNLEFSRKYITGESEEQQQARVTGWVSDLGIDPIVPKIPAEVEAMLDKKPETEKPSTMKETTMYYKITTKSIPEYLEFLKEVKPYIKSGLVFSAGIGIEYLTITGDYDKDAAMHPSISVTDFDSIISDSKNIRSYSRLTVKPNPEKSWKGKWVTIDARIQHIESILKDDDEEIPERPSAWITEKTAWNSIISRIQEKHGGTELEISEQFKWGTPIEAEHTSDPTEQIRIAYDHIWENPKYYTEGKPEGWAAKELSEEQKKEKTFEEFIAGTKVVDKSGKPLILYHGQNSTERFNVFDPSKGKSFGGCNKIGSWFTEDRKQAEGYSRHYVKDVITEGNIYTGFLSIKNPIEFEGDEGFTSFIESYTQVTGNHCSKATLEDIEKWKKSFTDNGYDGVIIRNIKNDSLRGAAPIQQYYIVFENDQIWLTEEKPMPMEEKKTGKVNPDDHLTETDPVILNMSTDQAGELFAANLLTEKQSILMYELGKHGEGFGYAAMPEELVKPLIKEGWIHADTYKFTGMSVMTNEGRELYREACKRYKKKLAADEDKTETEIVTEEINEMFEGATTEEVEPTIKKVRWSDIPAWVKYASPVSQLKFKREPDDKTLVKLVSPFIGEDALRPLFSSVRFEPGHIVATDAHRLIHLITDSKAEGNYCITSECFKLTNQKPGSLLEGNFPNWRSVIPMDSAIKVEVDLMKLKTYCEIVIRSRQANETTNLVVLKATPEFAIGFNGKFIIDICTALLQLGESKAILNCSTPERGTVWSKLKVKDNKKSLEGSDFILLMPMAIQGAVDYLFNYDLQTNEVIEPDGTRSTFDVSAIKADAEALLPISPAILSMIEKMTKKSNIPAIEKTIFVEKGRVRATNLDITADITGVNLSDGFYKVESKTILPYFVYYYIIDTENAHLRPTAISSDDFPLPYPDDIEFSHILTFNPELRQKFVDCIPHISDDEIRPVLNTIHFIKYNERLFIAATNTSSLILLHSGAVEDNTNDKEFKLGISDQSILLAQFIEKMEDEGFAYRIKFFAGKRKTSNEIKYVKIQIEDVVFYCRAVEGNPPNILAVVPEKNYSLRLVFDKKRFKELFAKYKKGGTFELVGSDLVFSLGDKKESLSPDADSFIDKGYAQGIYLALFGKAKVPLHEIAEGNEIVLWTDPDRRIPYLESKYTYENDKLVRLDQDFGPTGINMTEKQKEAGQNIKKSDDLKTHDKLLLFLKSQNLSLLLNKEKEIAEAIDKQYSRDKLPAPAAMAFPKEKKACIDKLIQIAIRIEAKKVEPWQMILEAYATFSFLKEASYEAGMMTEALYIQVADYRNKHKDYVQAAIKEGKAVPAQVLAEYPELTESFPVNTPIDEARKANENEFVSPRTGFIRFTDDPDPKDRLKIYLVNGQEVRKEHIEFVSGGHGYVYDYVPKDEIWIDDNQRDKPEDMEATIQHEIFEVRKMRDEGLTYDDAHELANEMEQKLRNKIGQKIKVKWITLQINGQGPKYTDYDFNAANETFRMLLGEGKFSNMEYEIHFADGETISGSIDCEPDYCSKLKNPLSDHIRNFYGNIAKADISKYKSLLTQDQIDSAKELLEKYDLGDNLEQKQPEMEQKAPKKERYTSLDDFAVELRGLHLSFVIGSGTTTSPSANVEFVKGQIEAFFDHYFFDWDYYYNWGDYDTKKEYLTQFSRFKAELFSDFQTFYDKYLEKKENPQRPGTYIIGASENVKKDTKFLFFKQYKNKISEALKRNYYKLGSEYYKENWDWLFDNKKTEQKLTKPILGRDGYFTSSHIATVINNQNYAVIDTVRGLIPQIINRDPSLNDVTKEDEIIREAYEEYVQMQQEYRHEQMGTESKSPAYEIENARASLKIIRPFLSAFQYQHLSKMLTGEESEGFIQTINRLHGIIKDMPGPYQTDDIKGPDKIVHLHYFKGASDWYIVEKDSSKEQVQAFGYAILNGDEQNAEWGYVDIQEITKRGVELDFYWKVRKFSEVKGMVDEESLTGEMAGEKRIGEEGVQEEIKEIDKAKSFSTGRAFSEFLDDLHELDLWVEYKGREYRKFILRDTQEFPARDVMDWGIRERLKDVTKAGVNYVEAIISVPAGLQATKESIEGAYRVNTGIATIIQPDIEAKDERTLLHDEIQYYKQQVENGERLMRNPNFTGDITADLNKTKASLKKKQDEYYERFGDSLPTKEFIPVGPEISRLIHFLNGDVSPKEKAEVWNEGKEDAEGETIIASRSRIIPKTGGTTLWQAATKWPATEVGRSGQETKIFWTGTDLEMAIRKEMMLSGYEPKIDDPEPKPEPKSVSLSASDYANEYLLNKAIEDLLLKKWNDKPESWSADELEFISNYSGYGGLDKQVMKAGELLDKGSLFEYFTPDQVIEKMWGLAHKFGYNNGPVLEPSCGIGPFFNRKYVSNLVEKSGYEINKFSAKIAKLRFPEANINDGEETKYFEQLFIAKNYTVRDKVNPKYKLVIGNPPYGKVGGLYMGMGEKNYTHCQNYIDYFILRGLDLLEKDGLLIYIIGVETATGGIPFLDQQMNKVKQMINERGKLIDAYRLPSGVFSRTDVTSDIVVFRKR